VQKNSLQIFSASQIWGSCRSMYRSPIHDVDQMNAWSKSGNISTRCSLMKWPGSGVHVFELAFKHTEDILNRLNLCFIFVQMYTLTVICLCGCL